MLTAARVRALLDYDPETGSLTWRRRDGSGSRSDLVGKAAGTPHKDGYIAIQVDGVKYLAHRLAWLHVHGAWPAEEIDHRDRVRAANSAKNLRDVSRSVNQQNRSGVTGADFHKASGRWRARINVDGHTRHLGYFKDPIAARAAYAAAKEIHHA